MDPSIFMDKASTPSGEDLKQALGDKYELWMEIRKHVLQKYPRGSFQTWSLPKCMQKEGGYGFLFLTGPS